MKCVQHYENASWNKSEIRINSMIFLPSALSLKMRTTGISVKLRIFMLDTGPNPSEAKFYNNSDCDMSQVTYISQLKLSKIETDL